jgi:adenylate cyclase
MSPVVVIVIVASLAVVAFVLFLALTYNWGLGAAVNRRRLARDHGYFVGFCASGSQSRWRRMNRWLPKDPRCRHCLVPFGGVGRVLRIQPSRKNPNLCKSCFEMAPLGASDMEVGVLFADIRGFTSWCEDRAPEAVEDALNRFYAVSTGVLVRTDAIIDKLVGDQVMGLYMTVFPSLGDKTCEVMIENAIEMLRRFEAGDPALPVGVGATFGIARVGNLGEGPVKDFTAVGDVVNTAARLQARAAPGQIVMSDAVFERLGGRYPEATPMTISVKGRSSVPAHVLAAHS